MFHLLKLFLSFFIFWIYVSGNAFFEIVEIMPNTIDDKNLEYITLKNTSDTSQSLSWYILADKKKQYVFAEDISIEAWEKQDFFRPETKLILNNSDEEIYLYNIQGEKIDEVSYETSTKWEFLTFEDINTEWEDEYISEEVYISWEIFISDEVIILEVPEIIFWLQRPSYISQSGSTDIYVCDEEKDECKVNFDLWESFSNEFPERDYKCDINFGIWEPTGQEWRCNPNTIIFPEGEYEVIFKIWHEDDASIFSEKKIFVKNIIGIESISQNNVENAGMHSEEEKSISKIHINTPKIIVQSWLTWKWRYFYCEKSECKINLNYEKQHSDQRCFWGFANMEQSSDSNNTRCNPWYVTVTQWTHEMFLRVYENDNEENKKTTRFYVYNERYIEEILLTKSLFQVSLVGESQSQIIENKINIIFQWKISKEKSLSWSVLTCTWVDRCYVNLEGVIISPELSSWNQVLNSGVEDLEYAWTINWEEFSQKLNPNGIWVEWIWENEIIFKAWEIEEIFIINISASSFLKEGNWENYKLNKEIFKIEENKINFTQNFLPLKYDGLRISWKAPVWSRIEVYNNWEKVLNWISNEKWKYRLVSKNFVAWEYIFDTQIILESGEKIFIENSWTFILIAEKRINWFISKKSTKTSTKTTKSIKLPSLIMQTETVYHWDTENIEVLNIWMKIFLILMICLSAIFWALHLIHIKTPIIIKTILSVYQLRFWVKQKINLIIA